VPRPPDPLRFTGRLAAAQVPSPVVAVADVRVGDRLRVGSLAVGGRERVLVHGPNGAGKTTLLRVLAGTLEPDAGTVRRRGRIGYLAQEIPAHHPRRALLAAFAAGRPGTPEEHAERLLSLGLFRPADLLVPEGALSAGQRRRLSLARLLTGQADLLLLDEPSNHLSLTLVEELEEAIDAFAGALVVVSHDRALRRRFAGTRLELAGGRLVG
jgi:macrolide transport system ATP-binding/permease protein